MPLDLLLLNLARFSLICAGALLGLIYVKGAERVWRYTRSWREVRRFTLEQSATAVSVVIGGLFLWLIVQSRDRPAGTWLGFCINSAILLLLIGVLRTALIGAGDKYNAKGSLRNERTSE